MRWRLEHELGYRWTHQLEIRNTGGVPIYHMVFGTDSPAGNKIMTHLYEQAASEFPAMADAARRRRDRMKREEQGQFDLFSMMGGIDEVLCSPRSRRRSPSTSTFHRNRPRDHDFSSCPYCRWPTRFSSTGA